MRPTFWMQTDTILGTTSSRHEQSGNLQQGRRVEIQQRTVNIGVGLIISEADSYGLGVAIMLSDLNFSRIFPEQGGISEVNLGLPGRCTPWRRPERYGNSTSRHPSPPTHKSSLARRSPITEYPIGSPTHSTGLIFGFGVIVAIIVGLVIR